MAPPWQICPDSGALNGMSIVRFETFLGDFANFMASAKRNDPTLTGNELRGQGLTAFRFEVEL